jgi:solute carrier family 25 protein 39/40
MMHRKGTHNATLLRALASEVASGGSWRALWRGLGPTLWRDVPFSGIYWMGYEAIKAALMARLPKRGGNDGRPSAAETYGVAFVGGVGAGSVAAFATTPFDVVKTRLQVEAYRTVTTASSSAGAGVAAAASAARAADSLPSASTGALLQRVLREEGVRGLFTGLGPRVAKVAPACAIMISTYELGKNLLHVEPGGGATQVR